LLVVPNGVYKSSINPFTNSYPVYSHPKIMTICWILPIALGIYKVLEVSETGSVQVVRCRNGKGSFRLSPLDRASLQRKYCRILGSASPIFTDITLFSLLKVDRCFGGIYHFHFEGRRTSQAINSSWQAETLSV
jgi:hypothetical protein